MSVVPAPAPALSASYPLDREHSGLRAAVLILFVVSGLAAFIISGALIGDAGIDLLSILIGLSVGAGIGYLGEKLLKRVWPSGRVLTIDDGGVRLTRREQVEEEIRSYQTVSALLWTFKTPRRSKVPKGWLLLACALEHDDAQLTVYTLMSPKQFDAYAHAKRFQILQPRKQQAKQTGSPLREDFASEGEQRRLREAENLRWLRGAEMQVDDFIAYIEALSTHFPDWMPRS